MFARAILLAAGLMGPATAMAQAANAPLVLERQIPLRQVRGRVDHLGIDGKRQRLLIAELGNNSLGVVDLVSGKVLRTLAGFREPQGVAYVPSTDSVYVANGGDGSARVFGGADLAPLGHIALGDDADNVRVDMLRHRVLVGYGRGALAVIDPATRTKTADIRLEGHPESFQIDDTGTRVFVNVPTARAIEVVDLATRAGRYLPTQGAGANFPMAIDRDAHRVLVVFRRPPILMALSGRDGHVLARIATCRDADDVFIDAKRHRVYVCCGAGVVDVLEQGQDGYRRLARVPTRPGARAEAQLRLHAGLGSDDRSRARACRRYPRDKPGWRHCLSQRSAARGQPAGKIRTQHRNRVWCPPAGDP